MNGSEIFVSVDIETSGPIPGLFSLLSIGACLVHAPEVRFYAELKPDCTGFDPEALAVTGFNLQALATTGIAPADAMFQLSTWLTSHLEPSQKPVFTGLNAPFDWSFINYYFHKYTGNNPFGFSALDIKAYFMGATGCTWSETKSSMMTQRLSAKRRPSHNALDDALFQAELFALMRLKEP
ncbi:3'-5' exonuclease [Escherichia coli]|nr:3'-5' exonuclease [Escherichia coli]EFN9580300.1 3'-5' exonuclease [Escherichia coli]